MSRSILFLAFSTVASLGVLVGATFMGDGSHPEASGDVLSHYKIPDMKVSEFRAAFDAAVLCVAVDDTEATGIDCWRPASGIREGGAVEVLSTYKIARNHVVEFVPASDPERVCVARNRYGASALRCVPR